jgi:Ion channel
MTTATTVGYGDVTPHNAAGRVVASLVMLTTIPLLAPVFALVTGAAAAAGLRRVLAMGRGLPSSGRGERDGLVLGLVHDGRFLLGVDDDPVVSSGDRLLIAQPAARKPVRR